MEHTKTYHRTLIVGFDGATLDLALPWIKDGSLPNLARLASSGKIAQLQSVQPVISAAAWTTFMTGVNPGKHGVYDFVKRESDSYKLIPTSRRDIRVPTLWNLLSTQNKRVFIMNVPLTYPPEHINGVLISGLGSPNLKTFTFPPDLSNVLWAKGYQVNRSVYYSKHNEKEFLRESEKLIEQVTQSAIAFITQEPWDLAMVVYRETDDVPHGFWRYMDSTHPKHEPHPIYGNVIRNTYQQLDSSLGKLLDAAGNDINVFVVSDHGFGPLYKDVFLNEWLRQKGYLRLKSSHQAQNLLSRFGITRNNISRLLRSMGLMRVEHWIKEILGDKISILPQDKWPDLHAGIDWEHTKAYSRGFQGQIFINLVGREPHGTVNPGTQYAEICRALTNDLLSLKDPEDNNPVVTQVYTREMLYHGPHIESAPDLVLVMRNYGYVTRLGYELGHQGGQIFGESRIGESGGHRPNGLIIAAGPDIKHEEGLSPDVWIGDVAPTILHILNCPVPIWMDGVVQMDWLTGDILSRKITFQNSSNTPMENTAAPTDESDEMMQRLRDLGYL